MFHVTVYFADFRKHTFCPLQLLVGEICIGQQGSFNDRNILEIKRRCVEKNS